MVTLQTSAEAKEILSTDGFARYFDVSMCLPATTEKYGLGMLFGSRFT